MQPIYLFYAIMAHPKKDKKKCDKKKAFTNTFFLSKFK